MTAVRRAGLAAVAVGAALVAACGDSAGPRAADPPRHPAAAGRSAALASGSAVVWAVGDGADGGAAAKGVVARIARLGIDRLLYLGDVYRHRSAADFARSYGSTYGRFARITLPTPGNHDAPTRRSGYDAYWRGVLGRRVAHYYRATLAGWQILSLDSEIAHGARSAQLRWLGRRLGGAGDCRIAFWHRPRYSAGRVHGDAPDVQPFWAALRGHARLVLVGHDHDMQRFSSRDGIVELVSGAGGHSHYGLRPHAGLAFGDTAHYGALRLILRPGRARYAFIAADGRRLDAGSITCKTS